MRYKARLVAQDFSQRSEIEFDETYASMMDAITLRFLISLAAKERLDMRLMDVVTAYLYGSLDCDIYIKISERFKISGVKYLNYRNMYSVNLQRSLYRLKQSDRIWYNRLSEYLLKMRYSNNSIYPCIFIKNLILSLLSLLCTYMIRISLERLKKFRRL